MTPSTFEERWVHLAFAAISHWPHWLRIVVAVWIPLGVLFVFVDELHDNVPYWLNVVMVAPLAILFITVVVPAVLGMWLRWLSWPFRTLVRFFSKS